MKGFLQIKIDKNVVPNEEIFFVFPNLTDALQSCFFDKIDDITLDYQWEDIFKFYKVYGNCSHSVSPNVVANMIFTYSNEHCAQWLDCSDNIIKNLIFSEFLTSQEVNRLRNMLKVNVEYLEGVIKRNLSKN